jgi:ribonuclease P protein component
MRFRPEQHLRRQSDFRAVREQGRRLNCGAFTLWCLRRPEADGPDAAIRRVGVVASTASVGHATRRNRAKRRLREVFRHHQEAVPAGCDLILTARSSVLELPLPELARKFVEACHQISATKRS